MTVYGESVQIPPLGVISLLLISVFIFHSLSFSIMLDYLSMCFICNRCDWWYEESNKVWFHLHSLFLLSEIVTLLVIDTFSCLSIKIIIRLKTRRFFQYVDIPQGSGGWLLLKYSIKMWKMVNICQVPSININFQDFEGIHVSLVDFSALKRHTLIFLL